MLGLTIVKMAVQLDIGPQPKSVTSRLAMFEKRTYPVNLNLIFKKKPQEKSKPHTNVP